MIPVVISICSFTMYHVQ